VVACGRRNVSSQIMKISASMLPSARPHELTYVGFMTGPVRSGCDRQHLFRLWRQTRSNCGATRRAIGLFWMATSAYGLLRTCAAGLTTRASAGIAEVSELTRRSGQGQTGCSGPPPSSTSSAALRHDATEFVNRMSAASF
jgi:hypothetical protein